MNPATKMIGYGGSKEDKNNGNGSLMRILPLAYT